MADLHVTEVDGTPCVWVEGGRPTLTARLVFRYGSADEPLVESGWQHLLEHLVLEGLGGGALQVNGSVSLLETTFEAHGPAELVSAHLAEVARRIAAPPSDRLATEVKVLRAEAMMRGGHPAADALAWRYGAAGPGVVAWQGPATGRATAAGLRERAARVLTRGNGVLVLDGPPPSDLRLPLPDGGRLPMLTATPVVDRRAAYSEDRGPVVSGVVTRSVAMALGHDLLRESFSREFRSGAGAAYAPWSTYDPVDADRAVVVAGSDLGAELLPVVVNRTLTLTRALRALPPTAEQVDQLVAARVQAIKDPFARLWVAVAGAGDLLAGRKPRSLEQWVAETRAVTPAEIRRGFEELAATLLLGVPGQATWSDELPVLEPARHASVGGRARRSRNWPADRTRLRVGEDGLELRDRDDTRTVVLESVAAVLTFDDGFRHVVQHDGFTVGVDPRAWHGGDRAVAELDRHVPDGLHLPQPPTERPTPRRLGFVRRWTWPLTHNNVNWVGVLLLLVALGLVVLAGYAAWVGIIPPGFLGFTVALCAAGLVSYDRHR